MNTSRRPQQLKSIVKDVIKQIEQRQFVKKKDINLLWDEMVGEEIAARTQLISLRKKVLTVGVDSSSWLYKIRFMKEGIVGRLREESDGKIEDLRFRLNAKR